MFKKITEDEKKLIRWIAMIAGGILVLVLIMILIVAFVKREKPEVAEKETESEILVVTEKETETETEVIPEGKARSPLTGEWIDEKKALYRPIAIMTENTDVTQPSYGTSKGDIYYECPMEGGLTRLMVLYQDVGKMKRIGNIRSARNYFIYFAKEYDAIYMHCGYSHFAKKLADSKFIDNINGITGKAEQFMYRTDDRRAPHNLYTSAEKIKKSYKAYSYRKKRKKDAKDHFIFAKDNEPVELMQGQSAKKVQIYFPANKPWFTYNEKSGLYERFQYDGKQMDGLKKKQLAVSNIIIQECEVHLWEKETGYMYVDCMSGGKGKYITRGKWIDITWKKKNKKQPTRFYDRQGNEITLNQGKTWIEIIDKDDSSKQVIQ